MMRFLSLSVAVLLLAGSARGQFVRTEVTLPDIPPYKTLMCDFHTHTVFSDGNVWPTVRVDEAWSQGYDAIAVTDHIEYQPHREYIPIQYNASYEIARPRGEREGLIVIRGCEVTRVMPPGHLNAIFIEDASLIQTKRIGEMFAHDHRRGDYLDSIDHHHQDYLLALEEAVRQHGFVFWNHPGWAPQAKDGIKLWDVHRELIAKGWIRGIEVANHAEWYPEAFQWCLDYHLALLGNSDVHETEQIYERKARIARRPATLVFARERSEAGIREALDSARTAVWFNDMVLGPEKLLRPLAAAAIAVTGPFFVDGEGTRYYSVRNATDLPLTLTDTASGEQLDLLPRSSVVTKAAKEVKARSFSVKNFLVGPSDTLAVRLPFD
jgi:hypothetical protein